MKLEGHSLERKHPPRQLIIAWSLVVIADGVGRKIPNPSTVKIPLKISESGSWSTSAPKSNVFLLVRHFVSQKFHKNLSTTCLVISMIRKIAVSRNDKKIPVSAT